MLYLLRSYGKRGKSILKIGFTEDLKERFNHYFYSNPEFEPISTRDGNEFFEDMIQFYLRYLGYQYKKKGRLNEWFIDIPEIQTLFHISREKLEKNIWINRNDIFRKIRTNELSLLNIDILEYLYKKNREKIRFGFKEGSLDFLLWGSYIRAVNSDFSLSEEDLKKGFLKRGVRETFKNFRQELEKFGFIDSKLFR